MKLCFNCLFGSCLFFITACNPQDQKLITKVETELATRQSELGHYETVGASLEQLQHDLEAAFPEKENAPVDSLKLTANAMVNKERSALNEYKDGLTSLQKRFDAYKAGNAKKEELELEYVVTNTSLGNMRKTFDILESQALSMREQLKQRMPGNMSK